MAVAQPSHGDKLGELASEELACRTQAGSSACFGELVKRYQGRLLSFLIQRTGQVPDAEDLLQEAFARAYQRIQLYNPRWKFSTWLFTIASRLACSHGRKLRSPSLDDARLLPAEGSNPLTIVLQEEEKDNLWALAAELLSKNQHSVLWLRYREDMSVAEISQVIRKTQTHVKVLLFRGRSSLARSPRVAAIAQRTASASSNCRPYLSTAAIGGG
jgi:RNA polymerase sigma-70 factor (ECF subfamily)